MRSPQAKRFAVWACWLGAVACSSPATGGAGSGADLDTEAAEDGKVLKPDVKGDVPADKDTGALDSGSDGSLVDVPPADGTDALTDATADAATDEDAEPTPDAADGSADTVSPCGPIGLGQKLPCKNTNDVGTCSGFQTCGASGLGLCDALTPTAETCNGLDDNCDGVTDEGLCDDGNPCTTPICGSDGSCGQIPETGGACNDGSACTTGDACKKGKCEGTAINCDDANPCTIDSCDLATGCTHTNAEIACADDGNSCTIDGCIDGTCQHPTLGDGATCKDDGNPCTLDGCVAGDCMHTDDPFNPPCTDDGSPCTDDFCQFSQCAHLPVAGEVTCTTDNNVCTDDVCMGGACQHPAVVTPTDCPDDGNSCTQDLCGGGLCKHPDVIAGTVCNDDGQPCTDDVCQGGSCVHPGKPYGAACADDGLPCTADTCKNGVCTHLATLNGQPCPDDNDPCTIDTCTAQGGCGHAIDPNKCEIGGKCYSAGEASAADPCKQCVPGVSQTQFSSAAGGQPCEDGSLCTVGETCSGGKCQGGGPKDCSSLTNTCATAACDSASGQCLLTPKSGPCNDGDVCTASDHCVAGKCEGTPKDCSPYDSVCTVGTCSDGTCSAVPKDGACEDGDPCTVGDACTGGKCVGTALDCSSLNGVCGTGSCKDGVCVATPKPGSVACDDGNGCTFNDQCSGGLCVGTSVSCGNLDGPCQKGVCDPATTGCVIQFSAAGSGCDDTNGCTENDHCDGTGLCTGSPKVCPATGNPCTTSFCSSGKCQLATSKDGSPCDDGTNCTGGDVCMNGTCTGKGIKDQYEDNNAALGTAIANKSDCEGSSTLGATMSPANDVDFYYFDASDQTFCSIYPDVSITGLAADYDLCVWFKCHGGESSSGAIGCDAGYKASGGPGGLWGCCSSNSGTAAEHVRHNDTCTLGGLGDDGGQVLIQVVPKNAAAANMCGGYTLTWKAN